MDDAENIFQYGVLPLKVTSIGDGEEKVLWKNATPNAARYLRPVYLIREKETDPDLLELVIKTTDASRNKLNANGVVVNGVQVEVDIRDTMKDLKLKRHIGGLGGAACILCKSKVDDWTDARYLEMGFPINRTAAETLEIFRSVTDDEGNVTIRPADFDTRFGVTKEALTDSDQHSITITHAYVNGCTWFMKLLYRCVADHQCWIESSTVKGAPIRDVKDEVRDTIKYETGLHLDFVNSAGGHGGTSTDGKQGRRFFSSNLQPVLRELLSKKNNIKHQESIIKLHRQLSMILRVVSCTREINLDKFQSHCKETMNHMVTKFPWVKLNHTLHGAIQHSVELISLNDGTGLGAYSEEGLEANNKDIRRYLRDLSRKCSSNKQVEDVHHRLLERSCPSVINATAAYARKTMKKSSDTDGIEVFFM